MTSDLHFEFVSSDLEPLVTIKNPAHSDDYAVLRFASAMQEKLAECRAKGRGGWDDPEQCSEKHLKRLFFDQAHPENPCIDVVDVANLCMMLHQRGIRYV